MNMHVERYGRGEKALFVHGSGWNVHMWYAIRDRLESSMEVILVDLPGHGASFGEGSNSVQGYSDMVYGIMKDLAMEGCFVVGHSLGGAIAISLGLVHPDIVKGIVLIGTGARLRVLPQILDGIIKDKEATVRSTGDFAFSKKASVELKAKAIEETMQCSAEVIHKDFTACDKFDVMDSIGSLSTPTLIICGTDDVLTPPKYSRYLNEVIPGSRLVLIEDAGHMVMMEKPIEVSSAIEEFVKGR